MLNAQDILLKLKAGKPLSIIRMGDGEAIILNGFRDVANFKAVLKRQLGFYPPLDHCEQIRDNLIKAFQQCDIIGLPDHKNINELNSHWRFAKDILAKYVDLTGKEFCSINVHSEFLDNNYFDDLLLNTKVLNYISCRELTYELQRKFNIDTVNNYQIAPEMKFFAGYEGLNHYTDQFNKIERWMDKCDIEGRICLVGAGVVGKIYCNWFRDRGGISIDIGSVFDSWAGFVTRGPNRGVNVEDSQYKL